MARRRTWADIAALLGYLLLALWILRDLWADPAGRWLHNPLDQGFFQAMMAHGERVVFHGDSPFHTNRLNAPVGVNLMANTSMLAVSIPLAPVTHVYGPAVTFAVVATLALAGTAAAWWWFLSRHLVTSRVAAWVGALWAGFAPGFVAHVNGQPNLASGYVVPFIVGQVIRLREPGRTWRGGALLGVLIALQAFVNEEFLLILAITLGLFLILYAVFRRPPVRDFLTGSAVAVVVAGALLAYPLYQQFLGPGHYDGVPFRIDQYATPLGSIAAFPRNSLAGDDALARRLSGGSVLEDATFWGPGICVMVIVSVALLWRSVAARALALAGFILLLMSLGSQLRLTQKTSIGPAPLAFTVHVPLLDLVTTPRYALATTTIIGILLALAADRLRPHPRPAEPSAAAPASAAPASAAPAPASAAPASAAPAPGSATPASASAAPASASAASASAAPASAAPTPASAAPTPASAASGRASAAPAAASGETDSVASDLGALDLGAPDRSAAGPEGAAPATTGAAAGAGASRLGRGVFWAGIVVALVPLFPLPVRTSAAPVVPAFFARGTWRSYVRGDQSIVMVPLPAMVSGRDGMRIAALSHLDFSIPRGYFLGPADPPRDNSGTWFPKTRYTVGLLEDVRRTGRVPQLSPDQRRTVLADLRYWRAGVVVLLPGAPHRAALRQVLTPVLGEPMQVDGVLLWRMPSFVGP